MLVARAISATSGTSCGSPRPRKRTRRSGRALAARRGACGLSTRAAFAPPNAVDNFSRCAALPGWFWLHKRAGKSLSSSPSPKAAGNTPRLAADNAANVSSVPAAPKGVTGDGLERVHHHALGGRADHRGDGVAFSAVVERGSRGVRADQIDARGLDPRHRAKPNARARAKARPVRSEP